eukprot:4462372-Amphidinium_carterae.1
MQCSATQLRQPFHKAYSHHVCSVAVSCCDSLEFQLALTLLPPSTIDHCEWHLQSKVDDRAGQGLVPSSG